MFTYLFDLGLKIAVPLVIGRPIQYLGLFECCKFKILNKFLRNYNKCA